MRVRNSSSYGRIVQWTLATALVALSIAPAAVSTAAVTVDYTYWYSYAQTKVYPTTPSPANALHAADSSSAVLTISAAQAEFEGRQISLRSETSGINDVWIEPSDLQMTDASGTPRVIPASDVSTFKVWYVNIVHPSTPFKVKGLQPDPLLPMTLANGRRLGWQPSGEMNPTLRGMAANTTQPFYVLFQVPKDAVAGNYTGSLKVTCADESGNPAPDVVIPVSLTVYPFSVAKRSLKTAFCFDELHAHLLSTASGKWLGQNNIYGHSSTQVTETTAWHGDQINGWLKYMSDHHLSPEVTVAAWSAPDSNGTMNARHEVLDDYMGTGLASTFAGERFGFNALRIPEAHPTSWLKNPFTSNANRARAAEYYRSMFSDLGSYTSIAYVYPVDEPTAKMRAFVQKYTAFIHRTIPGAKYLLTTDPATQKNKLVNGVDIYVERLQFFFRDSSWVKKIRKAHKSVWIYSHKSTWQGQAPCYLIDRPFADSRVQAWFAYRAGADGVMHWNLNAWRKAGNKNLLRDPYTDPLCDFGGSGKSRHYNNGDGSLVYPGYYPPLGLYVEGAPPVGSMRMEALRDGLEDYEYAKLVGSKYGAGAANGYVSRIIGPLPKPKGGKLLFPKFATAPETYESVRADMATALTQ